MTTEPFDPLAALAALLAHGVRFVLIGGFAGRLHGSPSITGDLDICYARDEENLERLAVALIEMGARLRGAPPDLEFVLDARTFRTGGHFTFATAAGGLDCLGSPAGVASFDELDRNAVEMNLDGLIVRVASLDDLIRMKRAAGQPKDLIEAEVLGALREEIEQGRDRRR